MKEAIRRVWMEISYDMLDAVKRETGKDEMSGDDVREIVADYCFGRVEGFDSLSHEKRSQALKEALPEESWCI